MNTTRLRMIGQKAKACRNDKVAYAAAIAELDAEIASLKAHYPDEFWDEASKAYRAMAAQWKAEREERARLALLEQEKEAA